MLAGISSAIPSRLRIAQRSAEFLDKTARRRRAAARLTASSRSALAHAAWQRNAIGGQSESACVCIPGTLAQRSRRARSRRANVTATPLPQERRATIAKEMPDRLRRFCALAATGLASVGCGKQTATQVIVELHAEPGVLGAADALRVEVMNNEGQTVLTRTKPVSSALSVLARVPLIPSGEDATRRFTVTAKLLKADKAIARIEARSGYVEDELRELELWFHDACSESSGGQAPDCGTGRTCFSGTCRGSCFNARPTELSGPSVPSCGECQRCTTTCDNLQGDPCGCPGDSCEGGVCRLAKDRRMLAVAAGASHVCAATRSSAVYCWGATKVSSGGGVLGTGPSGADSPTPVLVPAVTANVLAAGDFHTCAAHGKERSCWGKNSKGQLGGPPKSDMVAVPYTVTEAGFTVLGGGFEHSCGLLAGDVLCWGGNATGDLGTGDTVDALVPVPVAANAASSKYVTIGSGGDFNCAIDDKGALWCWGRNDVYQLGNSDNSRNFLVPTRVGCEPGATETCFSDWTKVAAGWFHACALRKNGELYCWGGNEFGQVGNGSSRNKIPELVRVGSNVTWQDVYAGRSHTCATDTERQLYCWGDNTNAQLGLGGNALNALRPERVDFGGLPAADTQWSLAALGEAFSCAVQANEESIWCWGAKLGVPAPAKGDPTPTGKPARVCLP